MSRTPKRLKPSITLAALEHFDQRLRAVEDWIRRANRVLAGVEYLGEQASKELGERNENPTKRRGGVRTTARARSRRNARKRSTTRSV